MEESKFIVTTIGAKEFAQDINNSSDDVVANWWELFSNYRLKKWRRELKNLAESTGISIEEACRYIGAEVSRYPGFYKRLPKHRETYIGIGMAYGQSVDTINRWITKYGSKQRLYVKDVFDDMIWIYLINANQKKKDDASYFAKYHECREEIESLYLEIWNQAGKAQEETARLEEEFSAVEFDDYHTQLKMFVRDNIESFRSAYARSRKILNGYVVEILRVKNLAMDGGHRWTLNSLRGWLDDSMINYLSGSYETFNTVDRERNLTSRFKQIPRTRKTHISLCLALGMSIDAIDEYLELMGYAPLDAVNPDEGSLINLLTRWEENHPLQKRFKDRYFKNMSDENLSEEEQLLAVNEMLNLRYDLNDAYVDERNEEFQY